jgi:hypothetical protein
MYTPGNAGIIAAGGNHLLMESNISINHTQPRGTWGFEARAVPITVECNNIWIFNNISRYKGFNGQNRDINPDISCFNTGDNSKNINNIEQASFSLN